MVRFEWSTLIRDGQPVAGAKYEIEVSLDPTFPTTLHGLTNLGGTSAEIEMALSESNKPYFWRLRGADPAYPNAFSEWSVPLNFTVVMDDFIDHGAGDCTIAAAPSPGPPALAILGLPVLLVARRTRRSHGAA